jgi:AcrR family transcriptional regulator
MVALLAEGGWPDVTISALVRRARVSRAAFYEHFADKDACLLAAYDRWALGVLSAMTLDLPEDGAWEEFVERSLHSYLGALEEDRTAALGFLVRIDGAGPEARRRRREGAHGFAALLAERHRRLREIDPSLGPLPDLVFVAFVLGVREIVRERLEEQPDRDLAELVPVLLTFLTALVQGASAAA